MLCYVSYKIRRAARLIHEILLASWRLVLGVIVVVVVVRIKHTAQAQFSSSYLQRRREEFFQSGVLPSAEYRTYHNPSAQTP